MKVYGALEAAQLEWFTDAAKPAASSYQYRVIYISDLKQVLVSDGTNWNPVNSRFTSGINSTATGASAAVAPGTSNLVAVTNTSLTSIGSLTNSATGVICVLVNETGNSIQILDEDLGTGTAANRIRTGTGAPITVANNSAVYLVYVANDSRWHVVGGVGSGTSSGTNFITNSNAEADTVGWATYANTAGASPVTGTGGTPTVGLWTRSTTSPLIGTASFAFTKPASNIQGQGASYDFTIDAAYTSKVLQISFEYAVASGTFAAGTASTDSDITVWIYDKTNNVIIQPTNYKLYASSAQSNTFLGYFQANPSSTSYRLILHVGTTSALAYTMKMDAVTVTPQVTTLGALRAPVGTIIATGSLTPPMGYLYADGSAVSRTQFANLFAAIGTTYGVGDGSTTFNLPNLKGIFARGAGSQTIGGITFSTTLGTSQTDQFQGHFHTFNTRGGSVSPGIAGGGAPADPNSGTQTDNGIVTDGTNGSPRYGTETRPANVAVAYHICYDSGTVAISSSIDYDYAEIGTVHAYTGSSAPTGFLFCDGTAVSRTTYADLYSIIGTSHGSGDGSTTFNLPDYRGRFLRGVTTDVSRDPDYTTRSAMNTGGNTGGLVGSIQLDDFKSHTHSSVVSEGIVAGASNARQSVIGGNTGATGGNETRPKNANVQYIIRYAKRVVPAAIAATETVAAFGQTTAGLSIPNATWTTITTPTIVDSTHSSLLSTGGVFTANTSGRFLVSGTINWGVNGTGGRGIRIRKNGFDTALGNFSVASSTNIVGCSVTGYLKLNALDTVTMEAFQNSGGAVSLTTGPDVASTLSIIRVGN